MGYAVRCCLLDLDSQRLAVYHHSIRNLLTCGIELSIKSRVSDDRSIEGTRKNQSCLPLRQTVPLMVLELTCHH